MGLGFRAWEVGFGLWVWGLGLGGMGVYILGFLPHLRGTVVFHKGSLRDLGFKI